MKVVSFGIAAAIALTLFTIFGSVGVQATTASVTTEITSMHAVLPDGVRVELSL